MQLTSALAVLSAVGAATALSPDDWRKQSIYQLLTDRFARTDGSTTATCNTPDGVYCGGSWQGVIDKLDYIQGMGFTAVCEREENMRPGLITTAPLPMEWLLQ